jgi:hypothetical protein
MVESVAVSVYDVFANVTVHKKSIFSRHFSLDRQIRGIVGNIVTDE